jgi:hypothetical protein
MWKPKVNLMRESTHMLQVQLDLYAKEIKPVINTA